MGGFSTNFDTEEDYYAIEFGFYLYYEYYMDDGNLTIEEFVEALEQFPDADKLDLVPIPEPDYIPTTEDYNADYFYN
jgi:hypothetical protein